MDPADHSSRRRTLLTGLAVLGAALLAHGRGIGNEFVRFDDYAYIVDNPFVRQGLTWDGVRWAFTSFHESNWHPLTWLSHMIDCELFGLEPAGHHAINVVLHGLNALLLFIALRSMSGNLWPSALVAALFAVHPLRVESVAWASERKDVLAGLFWMLALVAYGRYAKKGTAGRYALVLAWLALGLLAKPMLVTLPAVLLLLDIWPLGRWRWPAAHGNPHDGAVPARRLLLEKLPLFGVAGASGLITVVAQAGGGAVQALEGLPLWSRVANALVSYVAYLWKTVWPTDLAFYYPHPAVVSASPFRALVAPAIGAGVLLALITVWVIRAASRRPYLPVGWFWYLGTLVPVIGVFQVGNQAMADRYAYLPLIGIYVLVAWAARDVAARSETGRVVLRLTIPIALLAYGAVTWIQVGHWNNSRTLFEHALQVTRNNYAAHNNLGNGFFREGDLDGAEAHYRAALRIRPDLVEANNNLGLVLGQQGEHREAEIHFRRALEGDPVYAVAHYGLGATLDAQGRPAEARTHYETALRLAPDLAEAHEGLGGLLARLGDPRQAIHHYRLALEHKPGLLGAANALAWLLATSADPSLRDGPEALRLARRCAEETDYREPRFLSTLAAAHAAVGEFEQAVDWQTRALERAPAGQEAEFRRRLELYRQGRP